MIATTRKHVACRNPLGIAAIAALLSMFGCRSAVNEISLLGAEQPIRIAEVTERPLLGAINPFTQYERLTKTLEQQLGRPVRVEFQLPFQAAAQLDNGRFQFAILTPRQFGLLDNAATLDVIAATTTGGTESPARQALLVVPLGSELNNVSDLKDKRVGLGPRDNSRTYTAALNLLAKDGLSEADLDKGVPVLGGLFQIEIDDKRRAQRLLNGEFDAIFIDQAAWLQLPAQAEEGKAARNKFKLIAETPALPDLIIVAAPTVDSQLDRDMRAALLDLSDPTVLQDFGTRKLYAPTALTIRNCRDLISRPME